MPVKYSEKPKIALELASNKQSHSVNTTGVTREELVNIIDEKDTFIKLLRLKNSELKEIILIHEEHISELKEMILILEKHIAETGSIGLTPKQIKEE